MFFSGPCDLEKYLILRLVWLISFKVINIKYVFVLPGFQEQVHVISVTEFFKKMVWVIIEFKNLIKFLRTNK